MTVAPPFDRAAITGVVLAGGQARRMGGGDKGLLMLAGRPMIAHVLDGLRPQVGAILINANRNAGRYEDFGYPVVPDTHTGYLGPLAGLAAGMQAAVMPYVLTVPCDSPLVAPDLAARLYRRLTDEHADIAVAHDGERLHPVFTLLKRALLVDLVAFLDAGGRKIDLWFARHRTVITDFSNEVEAFLNVNAPTDLAQIEARLAPGKQSRAPRARLASLSRKRERE